MLKGRLGLETARIPQADRHGLLWLERGNLSVQDGTLHFVCAGNRDFPAGDYAIPFQMVNCILLQPGTTVSHDALRILARHGTTLVVVGEAGVRFYASLPAGADRSARARAHARLWADESKRNDVARRMYAWRLGEILPASEIAVLRGIEGARMKETYKRLAEQFGLSWAGRRYDRSNPEGDDPINQAINHASAAVRSLADVAVAVTGAIPQLGFIHEDSANAFCLDIADLYRDEVTLPLAFTAVRDARVSPNEPLDRLVRMRSRQVFSKRKLVVAMIEKIKELFGDSDDGGDA
ncbi:MAG: type I-E CRISPR-associated endonuclease Cas1e [bacterium]